MATPDTTDKDNKHQPSTTAASPNDEQRAKDTVEQTNKAEGQDVRSFGNDKNNVNKSDLPAADNTAPSAIKAREDAGVDHLNQ